MAFPNDVLTTDSFETWRTRFNDLKNSAAEFVESTSDPTASDDNYEVSTLWVNKTTDEVFILVDNTASNAIWKPSGEQTITLSGDATGSGTSSVVVTISDAAITGKTELTSGLLPTDEILIADIGTGSSTVFEANFTAADDTNFSSYTPDTPAGGFHAETSGVFHIRDNRISADGAPNAEADFVAWDLGATPPTDYTISASIKALPDNANSGTGIMLCSTNSTTPSDDCYFFNFYQDTVYLDQRVGGSWGTNLGTAAIPGGHTAGQYYELKVEVSASGLVCYVDGTQVISTSDTTRRGRYFGYEGYFLSNVVVANENLADSFLVTTSGGSSSELKRMDVSVLESYMQSNLNHDSLPGFSLNEHIDWTFATNSSINTSGNLILRGPNNVFDVTGQGIITTDTAADTVVFTLENENSGGGVSMEMFGRTQANPWRIQAFTGGNNDFAIGKIGTGVQEFYIKETGEVGISNSDPIDKLDVLGTGNTNINVRGSGGFSGFKATTDVGQQGRVTFIEDVDPAAFGQIRAIKGTGMEFRTGDGTVAPGVAMTIKQSGIVSLSSLAGSGDQEVRVDNAGDLVATPIAWETFNSPSGTDPTTVRNVMANYETVAIGDIATAIGGSPRLYVKTTATGSAEIMRFESNIGYVRLMMCANDAPTPTWENSVVFETAEGTDVDFGFSAYLTGNIKFITGPRAVRMVVADDGNVSIGAGESPFARLQVTYPTGGTLWLGDVAGNNYINTDGGTFFRDEAGNRALLVNHVNKVVTAYGGFQLDTLKTAAGTKEMLTVNELGIVDKQSIPGSSYWDVTPFVASDVYNTNSGNVGIGHDGPKAKLHVKASSPGLTAGNSNIISSFGGARGDTGDGLRMYALRTATDTIDDWDTTSYVLGRFVDATNMSSIEFRSNALYINATAAGANVISRQYTSGFSDIELTTTACKFFNNEVQIQSDGDIHADGDVYAFSTTTSSDIKLKKDLTPIDNALDKINSLQGYTYTMKKNDERMAGLIAQDVEKVLPEAVKYDDVRGHKNLDYNAVIGLLVEAVKELQEEVKELKNGNTKYWTDKSISDY